MSLFENLTLLVALLAVVVSIVSLVRTRRTDEQQARLQKKQEELTDLQLELLRKQAAVSAFSETTEPTADVRVSLDGFRGHERFVITNWGEGAARNVKFEVEPRDGRSSPIFENEYQEKFPIKELAPGGQVSLLAALSFGTGTAFDASWSWQNPDDATVERRSLLSA